MTKTKTLATPKSPTNKNKKIEKKHNSDNKISIKKISNDKEIIAEFPLMYIIDNSSADSSGKQVISIPIFRKDKEHYTPGFCLPDEFTNEYRAEHQALQEYRVASESSVIEAEHIRLPKPSSRNSYCTICKVRFDDYRDHINLEDHVKKMKSSPYCEEIMEMSKSKKKERYENITEKIDKTETSLDERTNEDAFISKIDQKNTSSTKESLYEKVNEEYKKYKASSGFDILYQTSDHLYDVLY